jgi:hypothetical protein
MRRLFRFLRRSFPEDPHLWITFLSFIVFFVVVASHEAVGWPPEIKHEGYLAVISVGVIMLLADRLRVKDQEREHQERVAEQEREHQERLTRITNLLLDKSAALCNRPSTREEYDYLWGGYTGRYYVYNPSYRVDTNTGNDEIARILVRRYQNPAFEKARYLFLTKDAAGQKDLELFRALMHKVKAQDADVVGKIEVRQQKNRDASSEAEMYLGTRDGRQMGVMELKEQALDPHHGLPHYYLVIHDQVALNRYLRDHFERAWNDAAAEEVVNFWQ